MADWSTLPCDVLGEIALKLDEIEGFIYFSATCHSWNHACSMVKPKWKARATMMPWMLLAENTNDNPDCVRKVYNLSNNKSYQLSLPETFGARCWGSRNGWIALQTYDSVYEVHLINPLTKVRITSLPSLRTLPHTHEAAYEIKRKQWFFDNFMTRVDVNSDVDDGDLIVVAIYGEFQYAAFARPGDKAWPYIHFFAEDVICWGDVIYQVYCGGEVAYFDINKDVQDLDYVPACRPEADSFDKFYLLDFCGDLLMVLRQKVTYGNKHDEYKIVAFQIYRLDIKIRKWRRIQDIGNFSIFVGSNFSMFVPVSLSNNCMINCIYFTNDE